MALSLWDIYLISLRKQIKILLLLLLIIVPWILTKAFLCYTFEYGINLVDQCNDCCQRQTEEVVGVSRGASRKRWGDNIVNEVGSKDYKNP